MKQVLLPDIQPLDAVATDGAWVVFAAPTQGPGTGLVWLDEAVQTLRDAGLLADKAPTMVVGSGPLRTSALVVVPLDDTATPDEMRLRAAEAIALLQERHQPRCTVVLPNNLRQAQAVTEGVLAANHRYESAGAASDR
ncbi:MAG TPA: hypothetical protein VL024_05300, partial [Castellaniella sp.]|nr:hypothetical protein [Castellaniella sp.]